MLQKNKCKKRVNELGITHFVEIQKDDCKISGGLLHQKTDTQPDWGSNAVCQQVIQIRYLVLNELRRTHAFVPISIFMGTNACVHLSSLRTKYMEILKKSYLHCVQFHKIRLMAKKIVNENRVTYFAQFTSHFL
jgi:hypothetical protein